MAKSATPHDTLFKAIFSDATRAAALVYDVLPKRITKNFDRSKLPKLVNRNFVGMKLTKLRIDCLLEFQLLSGLPAYVLVLLEHKSRPDQGFYLQMMQYQIGIWRSYAGSEMGSFNTLPDIYPLLIYNGDEEWATTGSLSEMIPSREGVEEVYIGMEYKVLILRLSKLPLAFFSDQLVRAAFETMVKLPAGRADEATMVRLLTEIPDDSDLKEPVTEYMIQTSNEDRQTVESAIAKAGSETGGRVMGLLAESLKAEGIAEGEARGKAEGIAEGEARGKAEGKAETLLQLLQRRFGAVPPEVEERVGRASTAQLDAWLDKVIDAPTLADIFKR